MEIPVLSSGVISVSRRARVFAANQNFDGGLVFTPVNHEERRFGVSYAEYIPGSFPENVASKVSLSFGAMQIVTSVTCKEPM